MLSYLYSVDSGHLSDGLQIISQIRWLQIIFTYVVIVLDVSSLLWIYYFTNSP